MNAYLCMIIFYICNGLTTKEKQHEVYISIIHNMLTLVCRADGIWGKCHQEGTLFSDRTEV